jgi:hypothetical protein
MEASDVMDMAFREAFHAALEVSGVAAGCGKPLRDAYRAAFARNNPKHALVLLRQALGRADQTAAQLNKFKAHALGLLAEIEAAIPPDPEPAP